MQSVGGSLRRAGVSAASTRLVQPGSSSRVLVRESRRNASFKGPVSWVRDLLGLTTREQASRAEVARARMEQLSRGEASLFDTLPEAAQETSVDGNAVLRIPAGKKKHTEHKYSTANFKISHRKLNMLGRQISGKPIDSAILQMMFSEKRASKRIKSMLVVAKDHAVQKGLEEKKLVISQAWVTKGPKQLKRLEPKGRGKFGIRVHPDSKLSVVLKEGKTRAQLMEEERKRKLKRIVSAGLVREDIPLRNPNPAWAW